MKQGEGRGRNRGVDLLRLGSMFLVTVLHVLLLSGSLAAEGTRFALAWGMEVLAYCAVDCYGLISGYVGYRDEERPVSYRKFGPLWTQIFFWSFGLTLVGHLWRPEAVSWTAVAKAAAPVATSQYWFASAYAGLFFLMPWLNKLLRSCSKAQSGLLAGTLAGVYILYGTAAGTQGDPFRLQGGYSFAWLVLLYLLGGCMKKLDLPGRMKRGALAGGIALAAGATWLIKVLRPNGRLSGALVSYTSVTIVFIAFALVALAAEAKLGPKTEKVVAALAPAAFGVYLIHVHPVVWNQILAAKLTWVAGVRLRWFVPAVLLSAGGIFLFCLLAEKARLALFRATGLERAIERLSARLDRALTKRFEPKEN